MLRRIARKTITSFVAVLPNNTRRAVMEALVSGTNSWELFQAIGHEYRVRDICVRGDCGVIEGSLADEGIMAGYAKQKNWHVGEANRLFVELFGQHQAGTYIDIGANLGLTTIPVAALPHVDCKAFEPDPDNYRHLTHNVASHCPHGNVQLFNVAIGDRTGTIEFELDVHNHGDHRIHVAGAGLLMEEMRPIVTVSSSRLDDMFDPAMLNRPIVVKMDTQGSEGRVFAGGERLLAESALTFFEFWPYSLRRFDIDIEALTSFIGRTFSSGSIVPGDQDIAPDWQPIDQVLDTIHEHWRRIDEPFVYHEVYLRRD